MFNVHVEMPRVRGQKAQIRSDKKNHNQAFKECVYNDTIVTKNICDITDKDEIGGNCSTEHMV